jgi:hypothetical protein
MSDSIDKIMEDVKAAEAKEITLYEAYEAAKGTPDLDRARTLWLCACAYRNDVLRKRAAPALIAEVERLRADYSELRRRVRIAHDKVDSADNAEALAAHTELVCCGDEDLALAADGKWRYCGQEIAAAAIAKGVEND